MEWENGEIANESLITIVVDDPVFCNVHGREKNLLDEPRWMRFNSLAAIASDCIGLIHKLETEKSSENEH